MAAGGLIRAPRNRIVGAEDGVAQGRGGAVAHGSAIVPWRIADGSGDPGRADAPLTSVRPVARPATAARAAVPAGGAADLVAEAKLGGRTCYALFDLKSGEMIEAIDPGRPMPPASTAKAITSLYALEHLGAGYRFATRVIATGPVQGGKVAGDLVLAGAATRP